MQLNILPVDGIKLLVNRFTFYHYFLIIIPYKVIYTTVCIRKKYMRAKFVFRIRYDNNSVNDFIKLLELLQDSIL